MLLLTLPLKPRVSVRARAPLPEMLEMDSPEGLGSVTRLKLDALTLLPKEWSLPRVTVSCAPLMFVVVSGDGLDATVTAV